MAGKITDLFVNIGAKTDDFKKGTQEVKNDASALGKSFKAVGGIIAGAFAVSAISGFASEAAKLAAVAEGVRAAFERIGNAGQLEELRKATKGTVSDLELMKAAVQAKNFGIPLQQLGSLLAFAHQRAKDTGQSVDYLVNSIVVGIGRKSPLILDNLGISAVALKEKMKGVGTETASVGDVARAVGEIASEAMRGIGNSAETSAEKSAKLAAQWENTKVLLGNFVNAVLNPIKDALNEIVGAFAAAIKGRDELLKESQQTKSADWISGFTEEQAFKDLKYQKDKLKYIRDQITLQQQVVQEFNDKIAELQGKYDKLGGGRFDNRIAKKNIEDQIEIQNRNIQLQLTFINDLYKLYDTVKAEKETLILPGIKEEIGIIEEYERDIKDLQDEIKKETDVNIITGLKRDLLELEEEYEKFIIKVRNKTVPTPTGELKKLKPLTAPVQTSKDLLFSWLPESQGDKLYTSAVDNYDKLTKDIIKANDNLIVSFDNLAVGFAEGLGGVIAGTESFGSAVVGAMAGFMAQLGQQMIAVGFAGIALKKVITNPFLAIAAGTALIALAGAARATMAAGPGGSGGSRSTSGGGISRGGGESLTVQIEGVVKGSDIYFTQKNYNKRLNDTISRG